MHLAADHAYLTDFGISTHGTATATTYTEAGGVAGTVAYLAPEAILGEHVDGRADVYSLGCPRLRAAHRAAAVPAGKRSATLGAHLHAPIPKASETVAAVPAALDGPLGRALAKQPGNRWRRAGDFAAALEAVTPGVGDTPTSPTIAVTPSRPGRGAARRRAAVAGASVAAAAGAFAATSQIRRADPVTPHRPPGLFASAFWGVQFRYPASWTLERSRCPASEGRARGTSTATRSTIRRPEDRPATPRCSTSAGATRGPSRAPASSTCARSASCRCMGSPASTWWRPTAEAVTRPPVTWSTCFARATRCGWSAARRGSGSPRSTGARSSP